MSLTTSQELAEDINDYNKDEYFSDGELSQDGLSKTKDSGAFNSGQNKLDLRDYQKELAEKALLGHNTVICAPTGSGKTRVATHIILNHLNKKDGKKKKVAFLARTVPLTIQQYKSLYKYLPSGYKITYITGQSKESMSLKSVTKNYDVIVMTPMILQNNVERTGLRLNKFSLLVFDECHHTRKDEPYNTLMFSYIKTKLRGSEKMKHNLPQIIGLTASIGIENGKTVKEAVSSILNVMSNLDAPFLSTVKQNEDELSRLVPIPCEKFITLTERDGDEAVQKINSVMEKLESYIKKHAQDLNDKPIIKLVQQMPPVRKNQDYGQWAVQIKQIARSVPISDPNRETNMCVRSLIILSEYLVNYNVALEAYDLVELRDVINYLDKCFSQMMTLPGSRTEEEVKFYDLFSNLKQTVTRRAYADENPNLAVLSKTLSDKLKDQAGEARCIIFVRTRALAESVATWLNRHSISHLKNLNAKIFTGINAREEEGGMTAKLQEDTLQSFRTGETKVLVATSVAEEGLDIADCNLIIKYNHVGNEVTTVQTKGRARKWGGSSVLLGMTNVINRERGNQEKAKLMKQAINEITHLSPSEIENHIDDHQEKKIDEAELADLLAKEKKAPQEKVFKMVCTKCRKVGIDNTQIRTIYGKHRVSIDRDLLDSKKVRCVNKKGDTIDEIEFLGPVYCQGKTDEQSICGNVLGTRIKCKKNIYFAMGIKNFGFFIELDQRLQHFKKWDKVPYSIDELSTDDEHKYATGSDFRGAAQFGTSDEDTSDDSDEECFVPGQEVCN
ncbi:Antiviral innate immune response receptor RIG-I [Bulinus truncatus]|nr:Antiviral innate immune response receptor RIG-I [Bulinus truncatus]